MDLCLLFRPKKASTIGVGRFRILGGGGGQGLDIGGGGGARGAKFPAGT